MGTPDPFSFDATRLLLAEGGRRYTQSTMSYVSVAGLTAAITELLALGAAEISGHAETLGRHLVEGLRPFGWRPFRDLDAAGAARHLISLGREGDLPAGALSRLTAAGIVCASRGGRIRVSLAPYNDGTDIDALIAALSSLPD
jgi:selenocysteine lyase/cysteine desulfurase